MERNRTTTIAKSKWNQSSGMRRSNERALVMVSLRRLLPPSRKRRVRQQILLLRLLLSAPQINAQRIFSHEQKHAHRGNVLFDLLPSSRFTIPALIIAVLFV